jgi:hypothetical protein
MANSFVQKLIMVVTAGFAAACLLWGFRHIVQRGLHETGEGWSEMFEKRPARKSSP